MLAVFVRTVTAGRLASSHLVVWTDLCSKIPGRAQAQTGLIERGSAGAHALLWSDRRRATFYKKDPSR